jgi:hypothetical protein
MTARQPKGETFLRTDTDDARWVTIQSNDKKRGQINATRFFLNRFDYGGKETSVLVYDRLEPGPASQRCRPRPCL